MGGLNADRSSSNTSTEKGYVVMLLRSIGVTLIACGLGAICLYMVTDLSVLQVCEYFCEWLILCGLVMLVLSVLFPANDVQQRKLTQDILELEDDQIISNDNHGPFVSPHLTLPKRSLKEVKSLRKGFPYRAR